MKTSKLFLLLFILTTGISCKTVQTTHKTVQKEEHKHWSYLGEEGPRNWSHISENYIACDGNAQSPIDILTSQVKQPTSDNTLVINYKQSLINILNNGHTEEFIISDGNSIQFNGKTFHLMQFHMHTPSEHTVDGKHFPLEIHFVNKSDDNTYAVIGVLMNEGEAHPFLNKYLTHFPNKEGEYKQDGQLEIMSVLPNSEHFYHYKGSFTTPPCSEIVDWIILKEHPTASKEQLKKLHKLMHDNNRPLQPLNSRAVDGQ